MRSALFTFVVAATVLPGPARGADRKMSEEEKALYTLGHQIGRGLAGFGLSPAEFAAVRRGLQDAASGAPLAVNPESYRKQLIAFREARVAAQLESQKTKSKAYLAQAAKEKGSIVYDSGLVLKELRTGTGRAPAIGDRVTVHFRGRLIDGTVVDDTYAKGAPARFALKEGVIPCWLEGLQKMKAGGKARLTCPASLAFGDLGRAPGVPGGAAVSYEFELLSIDRKPAE